MQPRGPESIGDSNAFIQKLAEAYGLPESTVAALYERSVAANKV